MNLTIAFDYQSSFEVFNRFIWMEFKREDPRISNVFDRKKGWKKNVALSSKM